MFHERGQIRRELSLPCGRCVGCRVARARAWAIRCMHESKLHDSNSFITLTYDDDHYPGPCLGSAKDSVGPAFDLQLFMKRLRRSRGNGIRFFACGEYGEENLRPHFHALLFGVTFLAREKIGSNLWRSPELEKLWPFGMSSFGDVTYQSAGYVARYSVKKVNGDLAVEHYKRVHLATGEIIDVVPEFGRMSLRPGVGYDWFLKYWRDVYVARDACVVDGRTVPSPRYYDLLLARLNTDLASDKDYDRYVNSQEFADDCTPERLLVREIVAKASLDFKTKRNL